MSGQSLNVDRGRQRLTRSRGYQESTGDIADWRSFAVMDEGENRPSASGTLRVLLVEDEYYIADDLRRALADEGAQVIGPVPTVERALALIAEEASISIAVLDIRLGGQVVWPVVEALRSRGVDYIFATGCSASEIPLAYRGASLFRKPVDIPALVSRLLKQ